MTDQPKMSLTEIREEEILDTIEKLVAEAEAGVPEWDPRPSLNKARDFLAQVALAGKKLDPERLTALVQRCSKHTENAKHPGDLIIWANFMGCVVDLLTDGIVCMKDGRVATAEGWNYSNCEPDDLHSRISRKVSERLQAHIGTLTDAEPSHNPSRDPSPYDEKFDEVVQAAITEYLDAHT